MRLEGEAAEKILMDVVIQLKFDVTKEFFLCLQTRWCKHGSIPP